MNTVDNTDKEKEKKLGRYLQDFYLRHLSITKNNWGTYIWIWRLVGKAMGALSNPAIGSLLRRLMMVEGGTTQGYIVPLNRDLDYKGKAKDTVMPISMVHKAVEESSYRMIIDKCMCRDSEGGCKEYPTDLGCIMLGEGSRKMVSSGLCAFKCPKQAIAMDEIEPMKGHILDYFRWFRPRING